MKKTILSYYALIKPGVMYGNLLTAVAGYLCAAQGSISWTVFVAVLFGQALIISSACVVNNYLDRDIDSKMTRTQNRPSVVGAVSERGMKLYGGALFCIGFAILAVWTNWLTVLVGIVGFVTYVWLYGAWSKRRSLYGTVVGSISGAMPILGGYVAVSGSIDLAAVIVFLIVFFWQFPEFYSIAIYRRKEYAMAHVPVISVVRGSSVTAAHIFILTFCYVVSTLALGLTEKAGIVYTISMAGVGVYWLIVAGRGLGIKNHETWARQMFRISMYVILFDCILLSIGGLLP